MGPWEGILPKGQASEGKPLPSGAQYYRSQPNCFAPVGTVPQYLRKPFPSASENGFGQDAIHSKLRAPEDGLAKRLK